MVYVVKRSFKSVGKFYGMGSVITDPSSIKLFKTKLKEKKIIEVTKNNCEVIAEYFSVRDSSRDYKTLFKEALEVAETPETLETPETPVKKVTVKIKASK